MVRRTSDVHNVSFLPQTLVMRLLCPDAQGSVRQPEYAHWRPRLASYLSGQAVFTIPEQYYADAASQGITVMYSYIAVAMAGLATCIHSIRNCWAIAGKRRADC